MHAERKGNEKDIEEDNEPSSKIPLKEGRRPPSNRTTIKVKGRGYQKTQDWIKTEPMLHGTRWWSSDLSTVCLLLSFNK